MLDGIVEHGLVKRNFSWGQADLVQVRFGGGTLWALAGMTDPDGHFESWVKDAAIREDLAEVFRQPRRVSLSVAGDSEDIHPNDCETMDNLRCKVISRIEKGNPELLAGNENSINSSQSNVFIQSGSFPSNYLYAILAWDIEPGEINQQRLEGN